MGKSTWFCARVRVCSASRPRCLVRVTKDAGGRVICPVSRSEITNQPCVLLRASGQVLLKKAALEFAVPTLTCPVTGKAFKRSDVIELVSGGTGFAAHNKVEFSTYTPNC